VAAQHLRVWSCARRIVARPPGSKDAAAGAGAAVTVSFTLDHNRIVIDVEAAAADGARRPLRAWVDTGNPELDMSAHAAALLGLPVTCDDKKCTAPPPRTLWIGGLGVALSEVPEAKIPPKPAAPP